MAMKVGRESQERTKREPRVRPRGSGEAANLLTVRLSSGISANILDFRVPQKHVLTDNAGVEAGRKAGGGLVGVKSRPTKPVGPEKQAGARNRAGSDSGKPGNEFEIRNPACDETDAR